jgi:hypothetical protein
MIKEVVKYKLNVRCKEGIMEDKYDNFMGIINEQKFDFALEMISNNLNKMTDSEKESALNKLKLLIEENS